MDYRYIVISLVTAEPDRHIGCKVVREDALYPMIYKKVYGPKSYMDCFEWVGFNCGKIDPWWTKAKSDAETLSGKLRDKKILIGASTRKIELGRVDMPPESKVEWEGDIIKYPVLYTRSAWIEAYVEISAPDDLLNQFWGDIVNCTEGAAAVATLAAIFASAAAALPAFKAAFIGCIKAKIGDRVDELSIALSTEHESGDWHRV